MVYNVMLRFPNRDLAIFASEGDRNVRVSPAHRTADPATASLCAGVNSGLAIGRMISYRTRSSARWQKLNLWQTGSDLGAWLFTIMHNQYVNDTARGARTGYRRRRSGCILACCHDRSHGFAAAERTRSCTGPSVQGQREVVLLAGLDGMSYDEAAKILSVPIGTIRSRLGRAREVCAR